MKNPLLALLIAVATLALFYFVVTANLNVIAKGISAIILLALSGTAIQRTTGIEGQYGLLILRTTSGLKWLDRTGRKFEGKITLTMVGGRTIHLVPSLAREIGMQPAGSQVTLGGVAAKW